MSTDTLDKDFSLPFEFLMDATMLGVGVGFDTKGAGKLDILVWLQTCIDRRAPTPRSLLKSISLRTVARAGFVPWGYFCRATLGTTVRRRL